MGSLIQRSYVVGASSWFAGWSQSQICMDQIYLPTGFDPNDKTTKWPVIFNYNGAGESGTDNDKQLNQGIYPNRASVGERAIICMPQENQNGTGSGNPKWPLVNAIHMAAFDQLTTEFKDNIDFTRISMMGYSSGANGCWGMMMRFRDQFSAMVCIAGSIPGSFLLQDETATVTDAAGNIQAAAWLVNKPIRVYHCTDDGQIVPLRDQQISAAFGSPTATYLYTEVPTGGHSWDYVYSDSTVYDWILAQHSSFAPPSSASISSHTWK